MAEVVQLNAHRPCPLEVQVSAGQDEYELLFAYSTDRRIKAVLPDLSARKEVVAVLEEALAVLRTPRRPGTIELTLQYPETARDAAVLLVEQMLAAFKNGSVEITKPDFQSGLEAWLRSAMRVLKECAAHG